MLDEPPDELRPGIEHLCPSQSIPTLAAHAGERARQRPRVDHASLVIPASWTGCGLGHGLQRIRFAQVVSEASDEDLQRPEYAHENDSDQAADDG